MDTKAIQICGTGSGVGKSIIVTALCRILLQDGYKVCPFKAQNMALNSFVTKGQGEIGRAQAVQAQACRIEPSVDMNPILIKPTSDVGAQIIVRGKPIGNMTATQYRDYKHKLQETVKSSLDRLLEKYEAVIIEGAGSPAEINLKPDDIVNMKVAEYANAPVVLVGDIDKGGVFAWLIGTLQLLDKKERLRIKGFIINKFRGDRGLLTPGIKFLEKATGIKVLGVIPYFKDIRIPEEDGIFYTREMAKDDQIKIGVINLPHIANHTDFDIFKEEKVNFSYIDEPAKIEDLDIVIIPGTKNTMQDIKFLRKTGFEVAIKKHIKKGKFLVGICGGFQMLGKMIFDPLNIESSAKGIRGLRFFDFNTIFAAKKITQQIEANFTKPFLLTKRRIGVTGYEIHHGRTVWNTIPQPMFIIKKRGGEEVGVYDGAYTRNFQVWGTHIHGIFDNYNFRKWFLEWTRKKLGLPKQKITNNLDFDKEISMLARLVKQNLDIRYLYKILDKHV